MINKPAKTLLLAFLLLFILLLACVEPKVTPCDELEGTARFTPKAVERCGCPDEDQVPVWMEIPECSG